MRNLLYKLEESIVFRHVSAWLRTAIGAPARLWIFCGLSVLIATGAIITTTATSAATNPTGAIAEPITGMGADAKNCYTWPLRRRNGRTAYDGDTIYFNMPNMPEGLAKMTIRLKGIDTPEIRGKCESEKTSAKVARDATNTLLGESNTVTVCNPTWDKWGGRVLGEVMIDGESLTAFLIREGHGRPHKKGDKKADWCG